LAFFFALLDNAGSFFSTVSIFFLLKMSSISEVAADFFSFFSAGFFLSFEYTCFIFYLNVTSLIIVKC
jgi:hypothetical protein